MIGRIEGTIHHTTDHMAYIDVGGISYLIHITERTREALPAPGNTAAVWTHLVVRENALDLYGFLDTDEQQFFELLINVSGIGPKSALQILDIAPVPTLRTAIATDDTSYLTKVSGIGKRTAEKIIVELRDKLAAYISEETQGDIKQDSDVLEALTSLGYSHKQARDVMQRIPADLGSTQERIRAALKELGGTDA